MQGTYTGNLISSSAADKLLEAHDGDLALLYLFMQRTGSFDLEQAAGRLCRTRREMEAAYEKLMRMGLVNEGESCPVSPRPAAPQKVLPPDEPPEYTTEEYISRTQGDPAFQALVLEADNVYGKKLSGHEARKLLGIYEYYGLPAEIMMVLLHHCVSISPGRLPTLRFIEIEAKKWSDMEILTLEQAEEYIARARARREDQTQVAELLGIRGRKLSPSEKNYISLWLDMGFGLDVIELAYDRTVTNTGSLKWGYMNKIFQSWKERGLFTVAEIEEKDGRKPQPASRNSGDKGVDMTDLNKLFELI